MLSVVILVSAAILAGVRFFSGTEDSWSCQGGQWVKHGNPSSPAPATGCASSAIEDESIGDVGSPAEVASSAEVEIGKRLVAPEIEVDAPLVGDSVLPSFLISGRARGNWYFEASFPIDVVADDGRVLATAVAQAQDEWMTEEFVPFSARIVFDPLFYSSGKIVFRKDNPSGDSQFDKSYELPIVFPSFSLESAIETTIEVFFGNDNLNPGAQDCSAVFPVKRQVLVTETEERPVRWVAVQELLKGPSPEEIEDGYYSAINSGVGVNFLIISSSTAQVDFNSEIERAVGGSCRVASIRAQITETLKQIPDIKEVIISVDGDTETSLQP